MKKKSLVLAFGIAACTLGLAACSNHVATVTGSASVYDSYVYMNTEDVTRFQKFSYGMRYLKTDMTVTSGRVSSLDIKEVFSPMAWARIDLADYPAIGDDYIAIENMYLDETTVGTGYFAKYIQIGDYVFEGSIRNTSSYSDNSVNYRFCTYGQSIVWKWVDIPSTVTSSTTYPLDLDDYLTVDTSTYVLYPRMLWYIDCLESGNAHIVTNYVSSSSYDKADPNYPEGKIYRNELSTETEFAAGIDALENYLTGKQIRYAYSTTNTADKENYRSLSTDSSGTWRYNPGYTLGEFSDDNWETITGLTDSILSLEQIQSYFSCVNIAFASCEFASLI